MSPVARVIITPSEGRRSRSCFLPGRGSAKASSVHIPPRKPWRRGYIGDNWRKPSEIVEDSLLLEKAILY